MITEKHYTNNNEHPEDRIYSTKVFINELSNVQDYYFNQLLLELNLNSKGSDWLFDYIFNSYTEYEDFEHYLSEHNVDYNSLLENES